MDNLEKKIESILFFKNEPVSTTELAKILGVSKEAVKSAIDTLRDFYKDRGIVLVSSGDELSFGTHPDTSSFIEELQKEELSRELGRAGLETLAIVLYRGPVARRDIDYIRGVNSSFILRNLLIRGLIERADATSGRSYTYKPTLKLLEYLGVSRTEDLPEYKTAFEKVESFLQNPDKEDA